MRPVLLLTACLVCLVSGCGTVVNLTAPPVSGRPDFGPTDCFPFGGVTRSAELGIGSLGSGLLCIPASGLNPAQLPEQMLGGAWLMGVGLVALVDTPLSLAGDVVTLPIAYARRQRAPWATWWGEQAGSAKPESDGNAPAVETSSGTSEPAKQVGQTTPAVPPSETP